MSADVSPHDAALTIHNVNAILLSILKSARETKICNLSARNVANETQIEYIPWISSEGPRGLRKLLFDQHKSTVEVSNIN